jgi:hypothetical protein
VKTNQVCPKEIPLLFHYTNEEAMFSILKHNELWFSESRFMNDFTEGRWFLDHIVVQFLYEVFKRPEIAKLIPQNDKNEVLFNLQVIANALSMTVSHDELFIGSFCSVNEVEKNKIDSQKKGVFGKLSMWRHYGHQGYALVFDTDKLLKCIQSTYGAKGKKSELCFELQKVHYMNKEEDSILKIIKSQPYKTFIGDIEIYIKEWLENKQDEDKVKYEITKKFLESIYFLASTIKHPGFEEENEIRIPFYSSKSLKNNSEAKKHGKEMSEYVIHNGSPRLVFKPDSPSLVDCIKYIIIGPGTPLEQSRKEVALEYFLMQHDLDFLIDKIKFCTIPYV